MQIVSPNREKSRRGQSKHFLFVRHLCVSDRANILQRRGPWLALGKYSPQKLALLKPKTETLLKRKTETLLKRKTETLLKRKTRTHVEQPPGGGTEHQQHDDDVAEVDPDQGHVDDDADAGQEGHHLPDADPVALAAADLAGLLVHLVVRTALAHAREDLR